VEKLGKGGLQENSFHCDSCGQFIITASTKVSEAVSRISTSIKKRPLKNNELNFGFTAEITPAKVVIKL